MDKTATTNNTIVNNDIAAFLLFPSVFLSGVDVYAGCAKDYSGEQVTAATFLAVITGDAATAGGRVLQSTSKDRVFINFVGKAI